MKTFRILLMAAAFAVAGMTMTACGGDDGNGPDPVDKTGLKTELDGANRLMNDSTQGSEPGQYPESAMTAFRAAINTAKGVYDDEKSTQKQVDDAVTALKAAVVVFKDAVVPEPGKPVVDKSALEISLTGARSTIGAAVVGNQQGEYLQEVVDTFQAEVDKAQLVYDNEEATQAQVDTAVSELDAAKVVFLESDNKEVIDTSLSLHLKFDGDAQDASFFKHSVELKQGETGQSAPALTADRMGAPNSAYEFAGGFMSIPNDDSLNPPTMTVMYWQKMSQLSPTDMAPISLNWWDCWMGKVIGGAETNEIAFQAVAPIQSGVFVNLNQWYHVAVTRSATELAIYVDGELRNTEAVAGEMHRMDGQPLRIGVLSENPGYYYPYFGALDEVRIYSRPLTADEVKAIYDEEKP